MIELIVSCSLAVLLLVLLFALSASNHRAAELADEEELGARRRSGAAYLPPGMVRHLFSHEDRDFVASLQSRALLGAFQKERKQVALYWVRHTASEVSRAMREHTRQAGRSANLRVSNELQLLWRFTMLRLTCGLLVLLLGFIEPHALSRLASRAGRLSENFLSVRSDLEVQEVPARQGI